MPLARAGVTGITARNHESTRRPHACGMRRWGHSRSLKASQTLRNRPCRLPRKMTASLVRTAAALLLGSTAMLSQAGTMTYLGPAHNNFNDVNVTISDHSPPPVNVSAGAFMGKVSFASGGESGFTSDLTNFVTYCVEIDQTFGFSNTGMQGYSVVAGSSSRLLGQPQCEQGQCARQTDQLRHAGLGNVLSYCRLQQHPGRHGRRVDFAATGDLERHLRHGQCRDFGPGRSGAFKDANSLQHDYNYLCQHPAD